MIHLKSGTKPLSLPTSWARQPWAAVAGICLLAAAATAGCQAIEDERTVNTESLLQEAGFQARFADTPENLGHVTALEQRTFVKKDHNGKQFYVYADAKGCKCIYYGTPAEYQRYRVLENDQQIAVNNRMNAVMNNAAAERYYSLWYGENAMPNTPPPPGTLPPL